MHNVYGFLLVVAIFGLAMYGVGRIHGHYAEGREQLTSYRRGYHEGNRDGWKRCKELLGQIPRAKPSPHPNSGPVYTPGRIGAHAATELLPRVTDTD